MLFQTAFCFAFLGSYIFVSDKKVKAKSNRNRNCIISFHWESRGSHIGSFLLCFRYPPQFSLQTDIYIDELVEIFLKLSMKNSTSAFNYLDDFSPVCKLAKDGQVFIFKFCVVVSFETQGTLFTLKFG